MKYSSCLESFYSGNLVSLPSQKLLSTQEQPIKRSLIIKNTELKICWKYLTIFQYCWKKCKNDKLILVDFNDWKFGKDSRRNSAIIMSVNFINIKPKVTNLFPVWLVSKDTINIVSTLQLISVSDTLYF